MLTRAKVWLQSSIFKYPSDIKHHYSSLNEMCVTKPQWKQPRKRLVTEGLLGRNLQVSEWEGILDLVMWPKLPSHPPKASVSRGLNTSVLKKSYLRRLEIIQICKRLLSSGNQNYLAMRYTSEVKQFFFNSKLVSLYHLVLFLNHL